MKKERQKKLMTQNSDEIDFADKKKAFLFLFSRQSKDVRESILNDLPAYHMLLSLEAVSFEEMALKVIAEKQGVQYSKDAPPIPECPHCDGNGDVGRKTGYTYRCRSCGHTFVTNNNSISSGSKCDALTWMKVLHCLLNFVSVSETCSRCGINKNTYYSIRNRLFYGMQLLLDHVKLYGEIQVDHTFVRMSYKGMSLQTMDVQEDSVFYDEAFKPRPGKSRGERSPNAERNANSVCVYTAIDDRGHVMARFAGIGKIGFRKLAQYIPEDKYLLKVPAVDPFGEYLKAQVSEPKTAIGEKSIMVTDQEAALEKHAVSLGMQIESHVYRRNGIQMRQPGGFRNVQKVNALHSRLKDFLRNCNYVSSKYLPGYLTLFEFIENTGGSEAAVMRLFHILATPNLGMPASFYQNMYTVPNYLLEWLDDDSALNKLPYNKLLAYYLYDHIRNKDDYPDTNVTMPFIEKETGYTAPTVRKLYKDLTQANYREKILRFFGEPKKDLKKTDACKQRLATFNPTVLAIYDEYAKLRQLPHKQRPTFPVFLTEKNAQFGTNYKRTNMLAKFKMIEESGVRPPLPEYNKEKEITDGHRKRVIEIADEYDKLRLHYREHGELVPTKFVLTGILAEKYGLTRATIEGYITEGHRYKKDCER